MEDSELYLIYSGTLSDVLSVHPRPAAPKVPEGLDLSDVEILEPTKEEDT